MAVLSTQLVPVSQRGSCCRHVSGSAPQFLTQPFVVGERVRLLGSGGSEVVSGVVESVRCCFLLDLEGAANLFGIAKREGF